MFHTLMNDKTAALKDKLKIIKEKNKTLNKTIQRRGKQITNLKALFQHLKSKNILKNDAAFKLANEFGSTLVPLLQHEKK